MESLGTDSSKALNLYLSEGRKEMKNLLAPVMQNKVVSAVTGEVGKFYLNHESAILTGGTIGFSMATTAMTIKNSRQINYILDVTRNSLDACQTKEEKNEVYAEAIKQLTPLVLPIMMFQAATIGCALYSKKQSDKKLAAAAGALSLANEAIARYEAFQKQTEEALGEKKYEKLQNDIYKNQEVDGKRFSTLPLEGGPGEILLIDKYSGRPFWSTLDRVENAAREMSRMISRSGGYDMVTIDDFYGLIGNVDLTNQESELAKRFGYLSDPDGLNGVSAKFSDSRYRFPNGTVIPAFEVYLYPEPGCIDWGC